MNETDINLVLSHWGFKAGAVHNEKEMAGSPERCLERTVVEDSEGRLFILERIERREAVRKRRIQDTLCCLSERGFSQILPYIPDHENQALIYELDSCWQLIPYKENRQLNRPGYIRDGWRGEAMADFLILLRNKAGNIPGFDPSEPFSIVDFYQNLAATIKTREPELFQRVKPARDYLDSGFAAAHDRIPISFCHGDFHPLNILWGDGIIQSVIDWEFLGYKPEIYDAANLIGCIGMEHPSGLAKDFAAALIQSLRKAECYSDFSWNHFFDFVLALRFAWLSEWLRKPDPEMIDLEAVYIRLLLENREKLLRIWKL